VLLLYTVTPPASPTRPRGGLCYSTFMRALPCPFASFRARRERAQTHSYIYSYPPLRSAIDRGGDEEESCLLPTSSLLLVFFVPSGWPVLGATRRLRLRPCGQSLGFPRPRPPLRSPFPRSHFELTWRVCSNQTDRWEDDIAAHPAVPSLFFFVLGRPLFRLLSPVLGSISRLLLLLIPRSYSRPPSLDSPLLLPEVER
jgi:hypothetical protein